MEGTRSRKGTEKTVKFLECDEEGAPPQEEKASLQNLQDLLSWKRKIKPLLELLQKTPTTHLEILCCEEENSQGPIESGLLDKCKDLYNELIAQVNELKEKVKKDWESIQTSWKELEEKEEYQLVFTIAEAGIFNAVMNLRQQMSQRKEEMQKKIQIFIGALRNDIKEIWAECMITLEEQEAFREFQSNQYTEEILEIHREELKKWQVYHKKNQEILTKFKKREEMWVNLRELEERAEDPNRFINRGGTLLKDQNLHNQITKNLPKLESELIKLADKFEAEHDWKMKIHGKEIHTILEEEWKLFKEEKATRKRNRQLMSTPSSLNKSTMLPVSSKAGEKRPGAKLLDSFTPKVLKRSQSRETISRPQSSSKLFRSKSRDNLDSRY